MSVLSGPRVVLRGFRTDDEDAVHSYAADPDVTRWLMWGPNTRADTERFVAAACSEDGDPDRARFSFAVTLPSEGRLVGAVGLTVSSPRHRRAALGFVMHRSYWSRGYTTEAATLVIGFGFTTLGLHRIEATCRPDNRASRRVLEKIGMRQEGHLREHLRVRGAWRDSLTFAVINPAGH